MNSKQRCALFLGLSFSIISGCKKNAPTSIQRTDQTSSASKDKSAPANDGIKKEGENPAHSPSSGTAPQDPAKNNTAEAPLVIEFPKEPYPALTAVSFTGLATPMDNTCPYLGNVTQTDGLVTVPFNKLGAAIPPATATNAAGFAISERAFCFVWGRIKKVPSGYRVQMVFNDASSLKISPNMRAFKSVNNRSQGDLFQVSEYGYGFAVNPAAADGFWYALNLTLRPSSNSFPVDTATGTASPMAQLSASISPLKPPMGSPATVVYPDECPKADHEFRFGLGFRVGVSAYTTNPADLTKLPNDGFTHSLYLDEIPQLKFTLVKCA